LRRVYTLDPPGDPRGRAPPSARIAWADFWPDNATLAVSTTLGFVLFDKETERVLKRLAQPRNFAAVGGDGKRFVRRGSQGRGLYLTGINQNNDFVRHRHLSFSTVRGVAISRDGQIVTAIAYENFPKPGQEDPATGVVWLAQWDSESGDWTGFHNPSRPVVDVALSDDGKWLAACGETVGIWKVEELARARSTPAAGGAP
jgi:hypothetical protein